jgi:hypothetical protein
MASTAVSLQPALSRIDALLELRPDWDTYGGLPPTGRALETARLLVARIAARFADGVGERSLPYDVAPIPNGGVGLEWRVDNASIEVWIGPDGLLGYLIAEGSEDERRFHEAASASPEELEALMGRVLVL